MGRQGIEPWTLSLRGIPEGVLAGLLYQPQRGPFGAELYPFFKEIGKLFLDVFIIKFMMFNLSW